MCKFMSVQKNVAKTHKMKTDNTSPEKAANFTYLGTTITIRIHCRKIKKQSKFRERLPQFDLESFAFSFDV
jgi:hypothetical protein